MIVQIFGAFVAVYTMSVVMNLPKKFLWMAGSIASVSWLVYLIFTDYEAGLGFSTFMATAVSAFISHLLARRQKAPVTMFLIPGILPLVPGVNTYRIAYHLIQKNYAKASFYLNATLTVAGMIAIAIFVIDSGFRIYYTIKNMKSQKKGRNH